MVTTGNKNVTAGGALGGKKPRSVVWAVELLPDSLYRIRCLIQCQLSTFAGQHDHPAMRETS